MTTILPRGADLPPAIEPAPAPKPPRARLRLPRPGGSALTAGVAALALVAAAWGVVQTRTLQDRVDLLKGRIAAGERQTSQLQAQLNDANTTQKGLQAALNKTAANTINATVSAKVLKSVFTVEAGNALGTAFAVRRSATGGTILITNYHVLAGVWTAGGRSVKLKQGARSISAQIDTVRPGKDLASVEVVQALPLLPLNVTVPPVGAPVLVVGSPLGLGGTVTTGVVSAHRTGLIQISAPISPGNSGGPVVDAAGRAVGIASEKIVSNHAEGLGFAIPIRAVCSALVHC